MPCPLLYPVEKKNYTKDPFIGSEWETLQAFLKSAYILTIFGYSAPKSDVEAKKLMHEAWGNAEERKFEEIEIIDIKDSDELAYNWSEFIHTHHYQVHDNFFDSIVARHPRRSCDATWSRLMDAKWTEGNPVPRLQNLNALHDWYSPLIDIEVRIRKSSDQGEVNG